MPPLPAMRLAARSPGKHQSFSRASWPKDRLLDLAKGQTSKRSLKLGFVTKTKPRDHRCLPNSQRQERTKHIPTIRSLHAVEGSVSLCLSRTCLLTPC